MCVALACKEIQNVPVLSFIVKLCDIWDKEYFLKPDEYHVVYKLVLLQLPCTHGEQFSSLAREQVHKKNSYFKHEQKLWQSH